MLTGFSITTLRHYDHAGVLGAILGLDLLP
jgi:hypothetical protein